MGTKIWWGWVLYRGYVHPHTHPHTQLKKSKIPYTHIQSMWKFSSKWGRVRAIPMGVDLFVISKYTYTHQL